MSEAVDKVMKGVEAGVKPIATGVLRIGQGVAGAVDMAASYSQKQAAQAKPAPPQSKVGWKDIPATVWRTLTEPGDQQEKRALENHRQHHQQVASVVPKVQKEARQDYEFADKEATKLEGQMGPVGKVAAKGVEMAPQLALSGPSLLKAAANLVYQTGSAVGKARSMKAAGPSLASSILVPGNSKLNNVAQNAIEDGIESGTKTFKAAIKKIRGGSAPIASTSP